MKSGLNSTSLTLTSLAWKKEERGDYESPKLAMNKKVSLLRFLTDSQF